jgi:hypothetical protein
MFLGSKVRRVRRVDNLTAICEPIISSLEFTYVVSRFLLKEFSFNGGCEVLGLVQGFVRFSD